MVFLFNPQEHRETREWIPGGLGELELARNEGDGVDVVQDCGEASAGESGEGRCGKWAPRRFLRVERGLAPQGVS